MLCYHKSVHCFDPLRHFHCGNFSSGSLYHLRLKFCYIISCFLKAKQVIPDWLEDIAVHAVGTGGFTGRSEGRFGARDNRRQVSLHSFCIVQSGYL